jgi:hypothetical protein
VKSAAQRFFIFGSFGTIKITNYFEKTGQTNDLKMFPKVIYISRKSISRQIKKKTSGVPLNYTLPHRAVFHKSLCLF